MIFHSLSKTMGLTATLNRFYSIKTLCTKAAQFTVDKNALSKLRKQTGIAFSNCRKALQMHDNDFEQALTWLNQQAEKEGWSKAIQLQSRPMSQGVIGVVLNQRSGMQLEVNCETDFVARNGQFLELVAKITDDCFTDMNESSKDNKIEYTTEQIGSISTSSGETIADLIAGGIGNIKENIVARRAVFLRAAEDNELLSNYVHSAGLNKDYLEIGNVKFGKYSSLVLLQSDSTDALSCGTQLGQHIVGMKPKTIGNPDRKPKADRKKEEKLEKEEETEKEDEEESELLHQEFLLDPDFTTKQWLEDKNIQVKDFVRYGVGEEIPQSS